MGTIYKFIYLDIYVAPPNQKMGSNAPLNGCLAPGWQQSRPMEGSVPKKGVSEIIPSLVE